MLCCLKKQDLTFGYLNRSCNIANQYKAAKKMSAHYHRIKRTKSVLFACCGFVRENLLDTLPFCWLELEDGENRSKGSPIKKNN